MGTRMKLPPVDYAVPATLDEAVRLLAEHADDGKIIAGGQSLIPLLAFRVMAPAVLIDIGRIAGLARIAVDPDGIGIGALVRWCDIEESAALRAAHPLLVAALAHVAHYQIRNRGTIGGSLAHADPSAELAGVAVTCGAEIHVVGPRGDRVIEAEAFFLGPLTTALAADELIVEMRLPTWPADRRWGFEEFALRRGDFALAGVAIGFDEGADQVARDVRIGVIGAGDRASRLRSAEAVLEGRAIDPHSIAAACEAASAAVEPLTDIHADAEYRRALVAVLLERALVAATGRRAA
jgi:carbon-monoxide dehydrogenase medium subunit